MPRKNPPPDAAKRIEALAADGFTARGVAQSLGTSFDTMQRWLSEAPELREAFERGREMERQTLHNVLYRLATEKDDKIAAMFLLKARHGYREGDQEVKPPTRKAAAVAVIANPFAGRHVADLEELVAIGEMLGGLLGERAVRALGIAPGAVESYGKAAIVGEDGELEHAAAILHPKLGAPFRVAVEKGAALIPSAKKRGGMGAAIDVPLGHKDAAFVRSHFDAMEVRVPDAPRRGVGGFPVDAPVAAGNVLRQHGLRHRKLRPGPGEGRIQRGRLVKQGDRARQAVADAPVDQ